MTPLERTLGAFDRATRDAGGPVWGAWDCLHFALQGAGRGDLIGALVPKYRTERGAMRALSQRGFQTLADAIDSIAVRTAAPLPGDIAFVEQAPIGALGLIAGRDALFLKPSGGLWPLTPSIVWRLGPCQPPSPPS